MSKIRRAILSCYDKTRIAELAGALHEFDVELYCTEGTQLALKKAGIETREIVDLTGVREILNGRVKTLHPGVHAGLLGIRGNKVHEEEMQSYGCEWIDFLAVNLHPVEALVAQSAITLDEVIDEVDIGGTAMVRSAATNFRYVTVVVNPKRYSSVIHELRAHDGEIPFATRFRLAQEAFATTAHYDAVLADYLRRSEPPEE